MYVTAHLPRANGITNEYASKNLDHLGIVSTICREINLASEINRIVGVDPRQKVTCGEAVVAMILNALGFVDRPLYLFPEFMTTKPVELLIGAGFKPEDFNDDVLGRTLDKLYRAGSEREMVKKYGQSLQEKWGDDKIWVWDSAVYSEKNLGEISADYTWITRVPETLSKAKEVLENADTEKMRSTALRGYRLFSTEVEYGSVKQRWIVVFSEKALVRETKTLQKKIEKEKEQVEKDARHFANKEFYSEEDAQKAAQEMEKGWKYHKISATEVVTKTKKKDGGRGRPRKDVPVQTVYRIKVAFGEDKAAIEKETLKKGKFIVATNELDGEKLGDEEALTAYMCGALPTTPQAL